MKCEICGRDKLINRHHKYARYKYRAVLYPEIDEPINIQVLCSNCHLSKAKGIVIWNEVEFCEAMGIEKRGKVHETK